jgi:hypothetical protein
MITSFGWVFTRFINDMIRGRVSPIGVNLRQKNTKKHRDRIIVTKTH